MVWQRTPRKTITLANRFLSANWQLEDGHILALACHTTAGEPLCLSAPFQLVLTDGTALSAKQMRLKKIKKRIHVIEAVWHHVALDLLITWKAHLGPHQPFLRQFVTLQAGRSDVGICRITLMEGQATSLSASGTLDGCPLVSERSYYGFEHPRAAHAIHPDGTFTAYLDCTLPLQKGHSVSYSSVIGTAESGQLRRAFSAYLEAIRPRRTTPMLHYNCWYDLSYSNIRYDEASIVQTIHALGTQLVKQRGVTLSGVLLDDGWDDTSRLWQLHRSFPKGFGPICKTLRRYGMRLGIWLSPWGGYGEEKAARLATAAAMGMEQNAHGLALSGQRYFRYFQSVCLGLLRRYHIHHFKLDGMGQPGSVQPSSLFDSDFDASLALIQSLRHRSRDLYINLTVGTYASPYWLLYADSIWRGGADHGFEGEGSNRQQWITFRDAEVYHRVVQQSSLFPLASLMLHGIILARHCAKLDSATDADFAAEVQSFFASGTQCQELYISPHLLSVAQWDVLASHATFAAQHATLLQDSHWIGGDPRKGEVYGWAAWKGHQAIITLRNPANTAQNFTLLLCDMLELPADVSARFDVSGLFSHAEENTLWEDKASVSLAPFSVRSWLLQSIH